MKDLNFNHKRSANIKNIIIAVLCVAVLAQSAVLIFVKRPVKSAETKEQPQAILVVKAEGLANSIGKEFLLTANSIISDIKSGIASTDSISAMVNNIIYSDKIINALMAVAYPLLYEVINNLGMMDFAPNIDLYPTGTLLAEKLSATKYYCFDKDGTRKPLSDVLKNVKNDWDYMNNEVSVTLPDMGVTKTSLWNTIVWGVNDKDSFFSALSDMSAGLRGVIEVCLQGKERIVNIDVVEFLLNTDAMPIRLDAATIFNSSEKSGYEHCLIPLYNMLGLSDGEYSPAAQFCQYTNLADIWRAVLDPVMLVVSKIEQNPLDYIADLLLNFVNSIESGSLCKNLKFMKMDGEFHKLASLAMKFENGPLYNLGQSLIEIIESMGIKISGSFNDLLDSLLQLVLKSKSALMPDISTENILACGTKKVLANGNVYYDANTDATMEYLINYVIQEKNVELILNQTSLAGTPESAEIISAVVQSRDGLVSLVNTMYSIAVSKFATPAQ